VSRRDLVVWARTADDPAEPVARLLPDLPGGVLDDGVIELRPLWSEDTDDMYALRSLPESVATSVPPVPPDRAEVARRCAGAAYHWLIGTRAALSIRDKESGRFAGEISLFYQSPELGEAMLGYGLMPEWRGRGYATRAVRLVAQWAFKDVGIPRLIAGTMPENVGSQRVLERAGFTREAHQRSRLPGVDGNRIDDVLFALLPSDV
jgi:RimJ/RimL family protein N-acetyltransferase